ncbi:MAG: helix-turn-helix domain-containing protein [Lachnospiraceae bacterium]|nr:helix-turn-helix domain-containing protein [Lachnospiraceae bacterium]
MDQRRKTSMSIAEMRRILGLGKTDSYWLIKKNYFKVITVNGKMRVMVDSFEEWYANQVHYKKVDGPPPGSKLSNTFSVSELADELAVSEYTVYELIKAGNFETITVGQGRRITKESFDRWYEGQASYRKTADREQDKEILALTLSMPDAARMVGVSRGVIYHYVKKGCFETVVVGGQKRLTKDSFEKWARQKYAKSEN